jgi:signal transduction histidine kinase
VHAKLEHARRLTSIAVRRLRSSLQTLAERPRPDEEDLPDMLRRLLAFPPTHDLDLSVEVAGTPVALPAAVRRSLYRVASECLFNTARHAGAQRAVIRLSYGPGVVVLSVADDGHGSPEALQKIIRGERPAPDGGYHFGLADLADRAEEMGGTMRVSTSDLGGIAVEMLAPVPGRLDE